MSVPVVYVAGPIRAANAWEREQNIRRAEALALEAWRAGAAAICPHAMGRFYDDGDYAMWIAGDLAIIARCDAVLVTPDWERSQGARAEVAEAHRLGVPVLHSVGEIASLRQAHVSRA